jgi:hypothetical protein
LYRQYALWATVAVVLLMVFFVINYLRDPPKPAHFEKIHFTLLGYSVFECLHAVTLANATTYEEYVALDQIGKYLTAIVLVLFIAFMLARLSFLSKSVGMFYEERLNTNPDGISRWRDSIDKFLIRQFVDGPGMKNKFIVQRPRK